MSWPRPVTMSGMDLAPALGARFGPVELLAEDGVSQVYRTAGGTEALKVCRGPTPPAARPRFATEVRRMTELSAGGRLVPLLGSGLLPGGQAYVTMRRCA